MIPTTLRGQQFLLIAVVAVLGAALSLFAQYRADTDTGMWRAQTFLDNDAEDVSRGCPRVVDMGLDGQKVPPVAQNPSSPVHSQVVNRDGAVCLVLSGPVVEVPKDFPQLRLVPDRTVEARGADNRRTLFRLVGPVNDVLMVSITDPAPDRTPIWWLPATLVCLVTALVAGAAVALWPRPKTTGTPRLPALPAPQVPQQHAVRHQQPPPPERRRADSGEAARPVELPALTTSGVSGLTVDRGRSGPFDVYAATQVGLSHAKDGNTREDAYAIGGDTDLGWVYLAVADGLGSAANSHAAAQKAVRTILKLLHRNGGLLERIGYPAQWESTAVELVAHVAAALDVDTVDNLAAELGYVSPRGAEDKRSAPACTLAFAALGPVAAQGYPLAWGLVGDCDLLLVDLDTGRSQWLTQHETKRGMISNATPSLPRDADQVKTGFSFVSPSTMVVLASDGMADAIRMVPDQYATMLPELAGPRPAEHVFGQLVGFDLPGLHDDRTLVAAWPTRGRRSGRESR